MLCGVQRPTIVASAATWCLSFRQAHHLTSSRLCKKVEGAWPCFAKPSAPRICMRGCFRFLREAGAWPRLGAADLVGQSCPATARHWRGDGAEVWRCARLFSNPVEGDGSHMGPAWPRGSGALPGAQCPRICMRGYFVFLVSPGPPPNK